MMKAAQLYQKSDIRIEEVKKPDPTPDDVIIKIRKIGICGTDIHLYKDHLAHPKPLILGHEFVGDVVEVGPNVTNCQVGDRVTADHVLPCNRCMHCQKGKKNLCLSSGALGINLPGAMAEYLSLPSNLVYPLPKNLSYDDGVLVEPLAIAVYAAQKANIKKGDTVAIIGQGPIGLLLGAIAQTHGAKVIGIDIEDSRLKFAQKNAYIDKAINSKNNQDTKTVKKLIVTEEVDITFEVVGMESTFNLALDITVSGGKIVVLGVFSAKVAMDMMKIVKKELEVIGSWTCFDTFSDAIKLLQQKKINLDGFITHRYPFADIKQAFEDSIHSPGGRIKTVIELI